MRLEWLRDLFRRNRLDDDIDDGVTNACRCGTYHRVRQAIHQAAALMSASPSSSVEEKR